MSEQQRPERLNEVLAALERLPPAPLAANRDELFFRAGEASARGERGLATSNGRFWPAAAAVLAFVAAGLGVALVNRVADVQVVYVERPDSRGEASPVVVAQDAPRVRETPAYGEASGIPPEYRYTDAVHRGLPTDGMIHRHDWAALSDAFAQQLRLQQERSQAARHGALAAAEGGDGPQEDRPRERARTYLELRDAMRAM